MPAGSYASRHPTSLCRRQRRGHAGPAALASATASAAHPRGGRRLRVDGGSEMLGCRLAILRRRLMQMNLQRWSEQQMVQFLDWSRLQGRAVAWDHPHTPEMGKSANATSRGSGELKRLGICVRQTDFMPPKSISACGDRAAKVRKVLIRFNRMRRKLRNPKASADTSSPLPEFEMWQSTGTCPPSPGSVKLGVAGIGMGCMQECNAGSMIAVDRSGSSSQLLYLRC